jgi:Prenyltransferase and squalene oxidase repeat
MTRSRARILVFLLTLTVGSAAAVTPAFAAPAAPAARAAWPVPTRAQAAAGWLARQMTHGTHFVLVYKGKAYPDQGLTIDAIFAFAATGSADGYGARAITWLEKPAVLSGYIGNGKGESYAGATAKTALAAEVRGISPVRFGGVNLLARLRKLMQPSGRFSDHSAFGDFSNAFSQSLAVLALSRHGVAPGKAVRFLASSQCANGGFPLDFAQRKCAADPDSTAMDVQALLAAGWANRAQRGLRWLARVQQRSGGFVGSAGGPANANSTGLAGEAFAAGKWFRRADRARAFLLGQQAGCSAPAGRRGAIAYNSGGFARSTALDGTAQGVLGLADIGFAVLSSRGSHHDDPFLGCSA